MLFLSRTRLLHGNSIIQGMLALELFGPQHYHSASQLSRIVNRESTLHSSRLDVDNLKSFALSGRCEKIEAHGGFFCRLIDEGHVNQQLPPFELRSRLDSETLTSNVEVSVKRDTVLIGTREVELNFNLMPSCIDI